jgi:N-acetylmuramoyl-L-alanine amidase
VPSPNGNERKLPSGTGPSLVVLHYTGMRTATDALERMCNPAAEVSAHYMIDEDGTVTQLVDEEHRAWHAGRSSWRGETDVNSASIGIELVNPGHEFGYRPFPEVQIEALLPLLSDIVQRRAIAPANVVGHSDVAPARKQDPGELFPWERLARHRPVRPGARALEVAQDVRLGDVAQVTLGPEPGASILRANRFWEFPSMDSPRAFPLRPRTTVALLSSPSA